MPAVELTGFCVLDRDCQRAKFSFTVQEYSAIVNHKISKLFHFAGHFWKLQVSKTDDHFGMFLRWYGTQHGYDGPVTFECTTTLVFAVLNILNPDESVSEGSKKEKDVFDNLGGGIGYSKIITLDDVENQPGFIIGDTLHIQLALKVVSTTYHDKLSCRRQPTQDFIQGLKFPFFGTSWYIILFPDGENPDDPIEPGEKRKACLYLMRETVEDHMLRHSVQFMISVDGGNGLAVDQHFYNTDSNVYGTASFMPISELKKIASKGYIRVSVRFTHIVPYFYFAYTTTNDQQDFGPGFHFKDHYNLPWYFELSKNKDNNKVQGTIILDPPGEDETVQRLVKRNKCLQMSWLAELLSPADAQRNLLFRKKRGRRRPLQEAILSSSGQSDTVDFPITHDELLGADNAYLDDDGCLCVRLSLLCSNFVIENKQQLIAVDEVVRIYDNLRKREADRDQLREQLEEELYKQLVDNDKQRKADIEEEKSVQSNDGNHLDKSLEEKDEKIKELQEQLGEYERLLDEMRQDKDEPADMQSLEKLIEESRPTEATLRALTRLAKTVELVIKETPLKVVEVFQAGALGQDTVVANRLELDFVVFLEEFDGNKIKQKVMLNVIEEKIKECSSCLKIEVDTLQKFARLPATKRPVLPKSSGFFKTSQALIFKLAEVKVSILLSRDWGQYGGYLSLYKLASKANDRQMHRFIVAACERQVFFVSKQPHPCKILINVVKAWSDSVDWRDTSSRPSSYLISLLVTHAYNLTKRKGTAGREVSFGRQVLDELAALAQDVNLRVEWDDFYDPKDFPINEDMFQLPFVRDPALPAHNVAKTGLVDWNQFREEIATWVDSLQD